MSPAPGRWALLGACANATGDVLAAYVTEEPTAADPAAVAVCRTCSVLALCAAYADEARTVCGIWGGRRRTVAEGRRRAAA